MLHSTLLSIGSLHDQVICMTCADYLWVAWYALTGGISAANFTHLYISASIQKFNFIILELRKSRHERWHERRMTEHNLKMPLYKPTVTDRQMDGQEKPLLGVQGPALHKNALPNRL